MVQYRFDGATRTSASLRALSQSQLACVLAPADCELRHLGLRTAGTDTPPAGWPGRHWIWCELEVTTQNAWSRSANVHSPQCALPSFRTRLRSYVSGILGPEPDASRWLRSPGRGAASSSAMLVLFGSRRLFRAQRRPGHPHRPNGCLRMTLGNVCERPPDGHPAGRWSPKSASGDRVADVSGRAAAAHDAAAGKRM